VRLERCRRRRRRAGRRAGRARPRPSVGRIPEVAGGSQGADVTGALAADQPTVSARMPSARGAPAAVAMAIGLANEVFPRRTSIAAVPTITPAHRRERRGRCAGVVRSRAESTGAQPGGTAPSRREARQRRASPRRFHPETRKRVPGGGRPLAGDDRRDGGRLPPHDEIGNQGYALSSSVRRKRAPPPVASSTLTVPPWLSATWRTIASPSPEPGWPRAVSER
jgi:hypothetical protein